MTTPKHSGLLNRRQMNGGLRWQMPMLASAEAFKKKKKKKKMKAKEGGR
ncbi:uncharacterized protein RCO7_14781 [Rhynchosporium graminicola]|uniref:Uncharacterized protein n=1 Tax=Rhynchosporium graminicola TaxID=2792576 RepID=A0A1E1L2A3_9HELO|nr:uncharacterized protein RCO7_14781 [Rhynchosporium commune]